MNDRGVKRTYNFPGEKRRWGPTAPQMVADSAMTVFNGQEKSTESGVHASGTCCITASTTACVIKEDRNTETEMAANMILGGTFM